MNRYDLYEGDGEIIGGDEAWRRRSRRTRQAPGAGAVEDAALTEEEAPTEPAARGAHSERGTVSEDGWAREEVPAFRAARPRSGALPEDDWTQAEAPAEPASREAPSAPRDAHPNARSRAAAQPASPAPLFDDFDRFSDSMLWEEDRPRRPRKKPKHPAAWIAAIVLSLAGILGSAYLTLPQVTGVRYRFLPTPAFANGAVLLLDQEELDLFEATRKEIFNDRIYPGIYIDQVHVGGMTREEAVSALTAEDEAAEADFNITVTVGNQSWQVTPERVPVTRNVRERVEEAWATGRGNSPGLRGTGRTPFSERVARASEIRSYPVSLTTEKTWDHEALRAFCEGIANYVNRDPVNSAVATFDFGTQTFTFTEDRPGARLEADTIYDRVAALLDTGDDHASLFLTPEKIIADVTKTELMNSFGLIAAYTTKTTDNKNRNTNIQLSAAAINGITVLPGEIFSFNAATGERTAEKGYKPAAAISGGQNIEEVGGGVCQTSSTLFNAVARADLEIVERSPHAWPSSYVEKGFDATVNWPGLDFKFKNNTEWPIFIIAGYEKKKVTVSVYGMRLEADTRIDLESVTTKTLPQPEGTNYVINTALSRGESKRTVTGRKGYVVETWKVWYQGEREIRREKLFTTTYKAYQETIEYNPT